MWLATSTTAIFLLIITCLRLYFFVGFFTIFCFSGLAQRVSWVMWHYPMPVTSWNSKCKSAGTRKQRRVCWIGNTCKALRHPEASHQRPQLETELTGDASIIRKTQKNRRHPLLSMGKSFHMLILINLTQWNLVSIPCWDYRSTLGPEMITIHYNFQK